jgi:hypothetical protein
MGTQAHRDLVTQALEVIRKVLPNPDKPGLNIDD